MDTSDLSRVQKAWQQHRAELRGYLLHRLKDVSQAEDLLQEVFLKAMTQGQQFCTLDNPRAWLYQVARNALVDSLRLTKDAIPLPEDLAQEADAMAPVDELSECVARVLTELSPEDREVIQLCDIEGMKQQDFALSHGLSLTAVKSRIQRARQRMRAQMTQACQVQFDEAGQVCCHVPRPSL